MSAPSALAAEKIGRSACERFDTNLAWKVNLDRLDADVSRASGHGGKVLVNLTLQEVFQSIRSGEIASFSIWTGGKDFLSMLGECLSMQSAFSRIR